MNDSGQAPSSGRAQFGTRILGKAIDDIAIDGSEVRLLLQNDLASMVHCSLGPGETGRPSYNSGISEIWYFTAGRGELWRQDRARLGNQTVGVVAAGTCVNIPAEVAFQLRSTDEQELAFLCVTTPPWSTPEQNHLLSKGRWSTTL